MAYNARFQHKRDTAANWEKNNPVLLNGEIIIVTTNAGEVRCKIGDGVRTYMQLPFADEYLRNLIGSIDLSGIETNADNIEAIDGRVDDIETALEDYEPIPDEEIDEMCAETDGTPIALESVLFVAQTLTETQQAQARANIGISNNVTGASQSITLTDEDDGYTLTVVTQTESGTQSESVQLRDGANGANGTSVGIEFIEESSFSGGTNLVEFTDGKTLRIKNGKDGSQGGPGEDGVSATHSWNGTVLTVTSASGTSSADLKGDKGDKGDPYTLTDADKTTIVAAVIESIGGNPVFGYVDENNNIIVSGDLPDGTYSVKYEMDNSTVDIGNLVIDSNTYYSVTNTLTHCTSNGATQAVSGGSYTATITANSGYELKTLTVTMGGTDVTASAVSGGTVNIGNVTGDIVITAVAEEVQTAEPTNFFDKNGTDAAAGRIGSDGKNRTDATLNYVTNYIPVAVGDVVYISGCDISGVSTGTNTYFMASYDASKAKLFAGQPDASNAYTTTDSMSNTAAQITVTGSNVAYLRFTCSHPNGSNVQVDTSAIVINIKRNGAWL